MDIFDFKELIDKRAEAIKGSRLYRQDGQQVCIRLNDSSMGPCAKAYIKGGNMGIDWDRGHFILEAATPVYGKKDDLENFQTFVHRWAEQTFPKQTVSSKIKHLRRELEELAAKPKDPEEFADVFILLLGLAEMQGINLMDVAARKMRKNRRRKWQKPDADGVQEHVKEGGKP